MAPASQKIIVILLVIFAKGRTSGNDSEGYSISLGRLEVPYPERHSNNGMERMAALKVTEELINYRNVYYYGEVKVGTPGENLRVMFDTGSPSMWVYSGCGMSSLLCFPCWAHRTYHHCRSSTYKPLGTPVYIGYLSAYVRGFTSKDVLRIGKAAAWVTFVEATSGPFISSLDERFDGILGLAPCSGPSCPINRDLPPPVIQPILSAISSDTFSVYLDRTGSGSGVLTLGGTDKRYFQEGTLKMHPTASKNTWKLRIDSIWVGRKLVLNYTRSRMQAFVDTGTSLMIGPPSHVNILLRAAGIHPGQQVQCDKISSLPTITFVIGGTKYSLEPQQYASIHARTVSGKDFCLHGLDGQMVGKGEWILGDNFLGAFYTVFKTTAKMASHIGFAKLKGAPAG